MCPLLDGVFFSWTNLISVCLANVISGQWWIRDLWLMVLSVHFNVFIKISICGVCATTAILYCPDFFPPYTPTEQIWVREEESEWGHATWPLRCVEEQMQGNGGSAKLKAGVVTKLDADSMLSAAFVVQNAKLVRAIHLTCRKHLVKHKIMISLKADKWRIFDRLKAKFAKGPAANVSMSIASA